MLHCRYGIISEVNNAGCVPAFAESRSGCRKAYMSTLPHAATRIGGLVAQDVKG